MSNLLHMLLLGGYSFLVLPAIVLFAVSFFDRSQDLERPSRPKLIVFLSLTTLVLALLGLLIWFNPYGREISSSLPAYGVLIVLVALLGYLIYHTRELVGLWSANKVLVSILVLAFLGLFGFLWLADHSAFYITVVPAVVIALVWSLPRVGYAFLGILSLLVLVALVFTTGGWVYIPGANLPVWARTVLSILTGIAILLSILLPASLFYTSLRDSTPLKKSRLLWSLVLSVVLLAGAAYQIAWDGIWSSAHARAFEDHLPFVHFMLSLIAGVLLALTLRGWRRLVGPLYTLLVTTIAVLVLAWGWNLSAFETTEGRAARVDNAITSYYRDHGAYPANLGELSPRYLFVLSPPVVVRTGGWCYQSVGEAYRLGYISGDFTYFAADFKVVTYAQKGSLSSGVWDCDEWLARFQAKELAY